MHAGDKNGSPWEAPLRVMVYECAARHRDEVRKMLCNCLERFAQPSEGECYLFIEFYKNKRGGLYQQDASVFRVDKDGVVSNAELLQLS